MVWSPVNYMVVVDIKLLVFVSFVSMIGFIAGGCTYHDRVHA